MNRENITEKMKVTTTEENINDSNLTQVEAESIEAFLNNLINESKLGTFTDLSSGQIEIIVSGTHPDHNEEFFAKLGSVKNDHPFHAPIIKATGYSLTPYVISTSIFIVYDNTTDSEETLGFDIRHNCSLNSNGNIQLNLYLQFGKSLPDTQTRIEKNVPIGVNYFLFEYRLNSDRADTALSGVKEVNVVIFKDDPRTSRGTVTVVQGG